MSRTCPECLIRYDEGVLHCPEDGTDLADVTPDDELIGRTVGSYRIVRLLGRGGMGAVYLGEHPLIGSQVAVKILHAHYSADRRIVDRFFNEARAVNLIGHDNILKILDLDVTDDGRHYCIMEFLHGWSLQELIKGKEALPLSLTGPILLQICEALQAAHDHHVVHRDLKPDNVFLTLHKGRKNFVKVVDFGIARLADERGRSTGKTQTGMVMGTPAYMSPEQASGVTARVDGRSDIYSLGCLMYQLATGKLPFTGSSFADVVIAHVQTPPPRPRGLVPEIPEAYEAVILRCLEKKPEQRYGSMRELHDAIAATMEGLGLSRELPLADAAELAAAQAERPRPQAQPAATVALRPKARPPPPPRESSPPPIAQPAPPTASFSPPPPRRSSTLLTGFMASIVVVAAGAAAFVLYQEAERHHEDVRREAMRAQAEARDVPPPAPARPQPVTLTVNSVPQGARLEATWEGGRIAGVTPFLVVAPKDARVHLSLSLEGKLPLELDELADASRAVTATLTDAPAVAVSRPGPGPRKRPARKKTPPERQASPDGTLPVEF